MPLVLLSFVLLIHYAFLDCTFPELKYRPLNYFGAFHATRGPQPVGTTDAV
jgi:hypothetical protein